VEPEDIDDPLEWYGQVAESLGAMAGAAPPIVGIVPQTGRIVGSTPAARRYLGEPAASCVEDLVESGIIARPDLRALSQRTAESLERARRASTGVASEAAEAWQEQVRVHLPAGSVPVTLDLVAHHRGRYDSDLVVVTVDEPDARRDQDVDLAMLAAASPLHTVFDRDARIVAIDPRWSILYPEPDQLIGTLGSVMVHPEDVAEVMPIAHELFAGRISRCRYTIRIAAPVARWVPARVELQTLVARTAPADRLVLAIHEFVQLAQSLIPGGVLSSRESEVVVALFDGLRIAQIAERDTVSVHTLRNQLKSVYRKLGVSGQAELLARFHPPGVR